MISRCAASDAGMPSFWARATMLTASLLSMNSQTPSEARMRKRSCGVIVRVLVPGVDRKPHSAASVSPSPRVRVRVGARARARARVGLGLGLGLGSGL